MTPEERAEKLFNGMRAPDELKAKIADAIRQAIQEEREACAQVADSLFLYSRHPIKEPKSVVSVEYQDDVGNAIRSRS